ncbi:MAG: hypothetical protein H6537_08915 [Bacteroidales bacterium]|nr:hypothetical protein [Bacteroidales bacterium]
MLIKKGWISINRQVEGKLSLMVDEDVCIEITNPHNVEWVGRGALKLQKFIEEFAFDFTDKLVLDVGAFTGGFTQCALHNGAKFVWTIDLGTNQLHSSLVNHPIFRLYRC